MAEKRYARALLVAERCLNVTDKFILAESAQLLSLTDIAVEQHQYQLACQLVRNAGERYGETVDVVRCRSIEAELLWWYLQEPEAARTLVGELLGEVAGLQRQETLTLANLMRTD